MEFNKIYCMDCLEGMKLMNDNEVDIIITSPPYNIGINYNKYNDNKSNDEYLVWIEEIGKELNRILKKDGSFFLNMGYTCSNPYIAWEVAFRLRKYFKLQNVIHWIKSIAIQKEDVGNYPNIIGDIAVGHYKPVNSDRYLSNMHEYIFHFTKTGNVKLNKLAIGVPYQDKSNIKRFNRKNDLRDRGNTWFIPYETIQSKNRERPHPATFPSKLAEMCIKLHGVEKTKLVLDPFMGLGNTAIACAKLGVNFIGFEIDDYYCDIAKKRLDEIIKKNAKKTIKSDTGTNTCITASLDNYIQSNL